jgi:hypothetical protein
MGPTQPSVQRIPGFFAVGKQRGREVNSLPQSSAENKNEWSYTSIYPTCPYRMNKEHFTCYILHAFMFQIKVRSTCYTLTNADEYFSYCVLFVLFNGS